MMTVFNVVHFIANSIPSTKRCYPSSNIQLHNRYDRALKDLIYFVE
ncbi:hypothetical protein WCLE_012180 [Wolbachia endosymbiont of Cimex lectularius]|nr:hypothetical protein WCLE_012180 [Wolbachia endosymbiont of Cimex lectularius]